MIQIMQAKSFEYKMYNADDDITKYCNNYYYGGVNQLNL